MVKKLLLKKKQQELYLLNLVMEIYLLKLHLKVNMVDIEFLREIWVYIFQHLILVN
jgi:hypothetical protein|uniref:Uncharacterized protein n=1 Tax=Siphoviridae sp. ctkzC12 TaxID=2826446 RepID=A0A8S5LVK9_9CAUD|nr:MAG TPA: hypothetical protein [Siphoviridae sp. ctkzC12]